MRLKKAQKMNRVYMNIMFKLTGFESHVKKPSENMSDNL